MNADQAREFVTNSENRAMLKMTGSYDMADKYARQLIAAEKRGAGATAKGEARIKTAEQQRKLERQFTNLRNDVNRATTPQEVNAVVAKAVNDLEKLGIIDAAKRDDLLNSVKQVSDLQAKKKLLEQRMKFILGAAGTGSALFEGYRLFGG